MPSLVLYLSLFSALLFAENHNEGTAKRDDSPKCESFLSGRTSSIPVGSQIYTSTILSNGRKAVIKSHDKFILVDLESGSQKEIYVGHPYDRFNVSPNGKMMAILNKTQLHLIDIESGKILQSSTHQEDPWSIAFLSDELINFESSFTSHLLDANHLKPLLKADFGIGPPLDGKLSPNGRYFVATGKTFEAKVYDTKDKKLLKALNLYGESHGSVSAYFSPDSKTLITQTEASQKLSFYDLASGAETSVELPFRCTTFSYSPDGKKLFAAGNGLVILDAKTKKILKSTELPGFADVFSPDGKSLAVIPTESGKTPKGSVFLYDTESGKLKWSYSPTKHASHSNFSFSPDGQYLVNQNGGSGRTILSTANGRLLNLFPSRVEGYAPPQFVGKDAFFEEPGQMVILRGPKVLCANPDLTVAKGEANLKTFLNEKALCEGKFDEKKWDTVTTPVIGNSIRPELAAAYLVRFQRPDGFDAERHLSILNAILRSPLVEKEPDFIRGALETVMGTSSLLYEQILRKFPKLRQLPAPSFTKSVCRTEKEDEKLVAASDAYLNFKIAALNSDRSEISDWHSVPLLTRLLAKLPERNRESIRDRIADSLAHGAADNSKYEGVFLSKLYKFTYQFIGPWFGDKESKLTDLTVVREANRLRPVILGVQPIDGEEKSKTEYGFYAKPLPPVALSIPENSKSGKISLPGLENNLQWTHGKNKYSAEVGIHLVAGRKDLVEDQKSLPYDKLWKDGVLSGTVVTGTNLRNAADGVMKEYLEYFEKEGFKFDDEKKIDNLHTWLKREIAGGKMDYFVKEAHSDGDEKNLFRFDDEALLKRGVKKLPNGKQEEVNLIFPNKQSDKGKLLSNRDFGDWIRGRDASEKGPLVYFNGSCWSKTKAVNELEAAQSPSLINIPTLTTCYPFGNYETNAFRILLDNFRKGKNYNQIRTAMEENDGFKKRLKDVYLFPDEKDYDKYITSVLKLPIQVEVKVTDQNGRTIHIDEN